MPRATPEYPTPKLRQVRYVRAIPPVAVTLHMPAAPGEVRTIAGRVLGAMRVDGQVHHLRFVDGEGALSLVPPQWVRQLGAPEPVRAEVDA